MALRSLFRLVRGNPRVVGMPTLIPDVIAQSGFIFWDDVEKAARPATVLDGTPEANRAKIAESLIGFSMSRKPSGAGIRLGVATAGQWTVDADKDWVADPLTPVAIGDDMCSVIESPNDTLVIGRLVAPKTNRQTFATIEVYSRVHQQQPVAVQQEPEASPSPSPPY
jgi:hypothetical protein